MAENTSKTGILAKAQKRLSRTKTKVLQNLGKAEKTTDEVFTDNVARTERQQEVSHHLQKELKNYVHCVQELCKASKGIHNVLLSTYEPEWTQESTFKAQIQTFDLLWNDYLQNLQDNVVTPLQTYLNSFPALRAKISKRGRKMVDYDNARHHLEVLQAAKKRDEAKIQKAQEELKDAKRIYDEMNNDLHTELPDFYNSRVTFYASLFTSLFGAEYVFHSEVGKTNATLGDISQKLAKDFEQFVYKPKRRLSKSMSTNSGENEVNGDTSCASSPSTPGASSPAMPYVNTDSSSTKAPEVSESVYNNEEVIAKARDYSGDTDGGGINGDGADVHGRLKTDTPSTPHAAPPTDKEVAAVLEDMQEPDSDSIKDDGNDDKDDHNKDKSVNERKDSPALTHATEDTGLYQEPTEVFAPRPVPRTNHVEEASDDDDKSSNEDEEDDNDALYSNPPSNKPLNAAPPETLFMVQATHNYTGEDSDELTFEQGETIYVIQFENPEEQDDGWQMGIKQSDGMKGVFPENFTQKL